MTKSLEISLMDDGAGIYAMAIRSDKNGRKCESTFEMLYQKQHDAIGAQLKQEVDSIFGASAQSDTEEEILELQTEEDDGANTSISPERLITWLEALEAKKFSVTVTLNPSQATYFRFKDEDYRSLKTADLEKRLEAKLYEKSGRVSEREGYTYRINEDGSLFAGMVDYDLPVLKMLEEVRSHFGRRLKIDYVISQEELLLHLLEKRQVSDTTLIHLQPGSGKLIILKNGYAATPINFEIEHEEPEAKARILVQRLMLEIDKGSIESLYSVHISASPEEINCISSVLKDHIPGLEVYGITCEYERGKENVQALSLNYAASEAAKHPKVASFLPQRIREAQQKLKLRWHGMVLLLILAATPWSMFQLYENRMDQYSSIEREFNALTTQIAELEPVASRVDEMEQEYSAAEQHIEQIQGDARYATMWTQKLTQLEEQMSGIESSWLTGFRTQGNTLHIEGYSLDREQVVKVAEIYPDSRIVRVSQGEIRGQTVYAFRIRVRDIKQNIEPPEQTVRQFIAERGAP